MKVFSLEKYKASDLSEDSKERALKCGWPQKDDGMTREEFGGCWDDSWAIELDEWEEDKKYQDTATIKGSKLEYHLLPPEQLAGMAEIMNHGVKTHVTGYMDLDPLLYWNATMRHLMALRRGELTDEEGNSHALAIACNGVILDRQLKAGKELRFEK